MLRRRFCIASVEPWALDDVELVERWRILAGALDDADRLCVALESGVRPPFHQTWGGVQQDQFGLCPHLHCIVLHTDQGLVIEQVVVAEVVPLGHGFPLVDRRLDQFVDDGVGPDILDRRLLVFEEDAVVHSFRAWVAFDRHQVLHALVQVAGRPVLDLWRES